MSGVVKHIIGSFSDIGSEIIKETARFPGDIVGSVLESGGTPSGEKQRNQRKTKTAKGPGEETLDSVTNTNDEARKKAIARRALEEYVGYGKPQKGPSIWEKKQMEEGERKQAQSELKKKKEREVLRPVSTKPKQGNLYGLGVKIDIEKQRNVKAE